MSPVAYSSVEPVGRRRQVAQAGAVAASAFTAYTLLPPASRGCPEWILRAIAEQPNIRPHPFRSGANYGFSERRHRRKAAVAGNLR